MDLRQSNVGISKESKAVKPFGIKDKVGYLCGDLGNDFTFIFASMYLMVFYTNVCCFYFTALVTNDISSL